jgi:hypothetical protein
MAAGVAGWRLSGSGKILVHKTMLVGRGEPEATPRLNGYDFVRATVVAGNAAASDASESRRADWARKILRSYCMGCPLKIHGDGYAEIIDPSHDAAMNTMSNDDIPVSLEICHPD